MRFWDRMEVEDAGYGPRLDLAWVTTAIFDGGCPQHQPTGDLGPASRDRLRAMLACNHVAALHFVVSWRWARAEWLHVFEFAWPARLLHPRYQAPGPFDG